ncbi:MAG: DivIVA domain-containing protein [Caldithrix sp.]|nr:MAG: DivIVA domain-containing protein [Caldithrix sp.]
MKLTPLDIKKQEFKKSMRGYDAIEVDAFLEMVADEFESLNQEKNNLADEVLVLKTQLQDYQEVEKTLKETLMHAQESITESRETSRREANMTVREAEVEAEKILEHAKLKLAEMKNELVLIKAQKDSFARRLRHLLESQIELIGVLELDDLGFDKLEKKRPNTRIKPKYRQEPPQNLEQEKIEFGSVDDILPEEPNDETEAIKTVDLDETQSEDLQEPPVDQSEEQQGIEPEEKKSRISDQLIF